MRSPLLALAVLLGLLVAAPTAGADVRQLSYRVGPITVDPYQVRQNGLTIGIPKPDVDGAITAMDVNLVDGDGSPVPIQRLMLHHIVFSNLGTQIGQKMDPLCPTITSLDSVTTIPALAERFYGAGEERAKLQLPAGFGYKVAGSDQWGLTWMVMNHRARPDKAYIQYDITYDTNPDLVPAKPVWMDVRNCRADPIYDVPGGGRAGATDQRSETFTVPQDGRVIAGGGHVHGGGLALRLSEPSCGDRLLAESVPTWGLPSDPFYHVKPVLHEPGPIHMTGWSTAQGFPVHAGQQLKLTSVYDAQRPHTRVMGISVVYIAPPAADAPAEACPPLPSDLQTDATPPGRTAPPRVTVPLTGLDRNGRAIRIQGPPGRLQRLRAGTTVKVRGFSFSRPNLSVPRGSTIRWRFTNEELHDVTLASGPRGFSSPHYAAGHEFRQKLTVPGTYRLFCSLHPVAMTERIVVR